MRPILGIARNTFREAVRNKVLYSIVFFAVALILLAVILGGASLAQDARVVRDIGLFAISFFSDMIAIFIGVTMVYQELERKTVYNVLSKPVAREAYLAGKFLGMAFTLGVQLAIMASALVLVMLVRGDPTPPLLFGALWLLYVRCLVIASLAVFFSSFSTPYVSGFLVLGVWLVGSLLQNLEAFLLGDITGDISAAVSSAVTLIGTAVIGIAPDLSLFVLTTQLTHNIPVPDTYLMHATGYGLGYALTFVMLGALIFRRRDFI